MNNKYNIKEINYIKGIAILLVFIGHAATPSFLERPYFYEFIVQLIYSFHMPLFFLVSGFLSYKVIDMNLKENYFNFVKAKFYRLAVPFLTISFLGKHSLDIYLLSWFFQIASMILINNILKIDNYNIFLYLLF